MKTIVLPFIEDSDLLLTTHNYKSEVIEYFQSKKLSFRFEELARLGEQHNSTFTMGLYVGDELVAQGEGSSKKKGEEAAAKIFYNQTAELTNG